MYVSTNGTQFINLYYFVWRPWKYWYRMWAGSAGIS